MWPPISQIISYFLFALIIVASSKFGRLQSLPARHGHMIIICLFRGITILGNPGATSRDGAIFLGEILLQVLNSPWELILTETVPEVVEFHSADWTEKSISAQSARSSSRVTLSPSYTKQFSSSIDLVAWPVQREGCRGEFQKKIFNEVEEIASLNMWARNQYSSINFLGGFIESIS